MFERWLHHLAGWADHGWADQHDRSHGRRRDDVVQEATASFVVAVASCDELKHPCQLRSVGCEDAPILDIQAAICDRKPSEGSCFFNAFDSLVEVEGWFMGSRLILTWNSPIAWCHLEKVHGLESKLLAQPLNGLSCHTGRGLFVWAFWYWPNMSVNHRNGVPTSTSSVSFAVVCVHISCKINGPALNWSLEVFFPSAVKEKH